MRCPSHVHALTRRPTALLSLRRFISCAAAMRRQIEPACLPTRSVTLTRSYTADSAGAENGTAASVSSSEQQHFARLSASWWDRNGGPLAALHAMNLLRYTFLRRQALISPVLRPTVIENNRKDAETPLSNIDVLDVGCGGGIFSEYLGSRGARVTGIDMTNEGIQAAKQHLKEYSPNLIQNVTYRQDTAESVAAADGASYDIVVASEVIEHVADRRSFLKACCSLLRPGGVLFLSTINQTALARLIAIHGAEDLSRLVAKGTHDYDKFVSPDTLGREISDVSANMSVSQPRGVLFNPVTGKWSFVGTCAVNYFLAAHKREDQAS